MTRRHETIWTFAIRYDKPDFANTLEEAIGAIPDSWSLVGEIEIPFPSRNKRANFRGSLTNGVGDSIPILLARDLMVLMLLKEFRGRFNLFNSALVTAHTLAERINDKSPESGFVFRGNLENDPVLINISVHDLRGGREENVLPIISKLKSIESIEIWADRQANFLTPRKVRW
jgi:hypothetical protein